jgi:broad specificity phosphatase PhoE
MTDPTRNPEPTRIFLVRHGETDANLNHLVAGSWDVPLNATGRAQARAVAELMATRHWDALYASPLSRAVETARAIGAATGLGEPVLEPRLVEQDYGSAEQMSEAELWSTYEDLDDVPGREKDAAVIERSFAALDDIAARHPGQDVIVVCHGGVIYWVLRTLDPTMIEWGIRNTSVHSFEHRNGALTLIKYDDPLEVESLATAGGNFDEQNPAAPENDPENVGR